MSSLSEGPYLTSKTVFTGFIAAWFFADSPINRSSSVNETKDGVVRLPCSFATMDMVSYDEHGKDWGLGSHVDDILISTPEPS